MAPFLLGLFPLSLFLPWALARRPRGNARLAALVVVIGLVVLSLVHKKRDHYLIPLYPFATLFVWQALSPTERPLRPRLRRVCLVLVCVAVALDPLRHLAIGRSLHGPDPSCLRLAAELFPHVPPGVPLACQGRTAYSLAFVGERTDVEVLEGDPDDLASELVAAPRSLCLVAEAATLDLLRARGLRVERLATSSAWEPDHGWSLARVSPGEPRVSER